MDFFSKSSFAESISGLGEVVGIDYGLSKIGFAITDISRVISFPYGILRLNKNLDFEKKSFKIFDYIVNMKKSNLMGFVIGYPYKMDGGKHFLCQEIELLAKIINKKFSLPVLLYDERMTTGLGKRLSNIKTKDRKPFRRKDDDADAASVILNSFISCSG